ncbi:MULTISPECIES: DUF2795 domain-containing protein [Streptomycetaceae]|uniref:DUF2795 domain-containing protein n=1 Tax=Streptantibioticus cattleyicolor (strain ATCC 35852 / DSM 46488 / JCM 4925 / NBRC 14057 / NRRL 8057) TaxID=1003195 RepID=F8JYM8_STREN|nr:MULTISPECIES: DUF2795 domain-containing protein [Streptomycetaceae]AEW97251.1 hypothetical protein SCATT_48800 [Streptantibioticus cattleyicolor NRRL 8057 = DSM 46488]MYS61705.1 DUF2795 domain-containing protein [Streptomyces sp. SID5468]CCB77573.1 conserved protein of unknown function [Streptantibioticus cattleyicolor NRRL 8057 = DSM 46488]
MQRGSDRLSVHKDDVMKHELQGLIRSGRPTRVEEWHDPEPGADDDPAVTTGPVSAGAPDLESLRFELARHLGRKAFPAKRRTLLRDLESAHAPDALTELVSGLPPETTYQNVQQVTQALRR